LVLFWWKPSLFLQYWICIARYKVQPELLLDMLHPDKKTLKK
jgi:hypothetical protein